MFKVRFHNISMILIMAAFSYAGAAQVLLKFKDSVMVNDTLITLGDIAEIRCNGGQWKNILEDFVVGDAAPAGHSRFISRDDLITYRMQSQLKSVQLIASGAIRTCITTDFKEFSVGTFNDSIMKFINSAITWPVGSWELSILNADNKIKLLDKPYRVEFSGINNSRPKGQFAFQMAIIQGGKVLRGPVRCEMRVSFPVVVAVSPIMRGELITPEKCVLKKIDITHYGIVPCDSLSQVVGMRAIRLIQAGNVLTKQWLQELPVVEKGDMIRIISSINKIQVAVDAIARESGAIGEKIWVENSASHKMVRVVIKSKGYAEL